jgi:hypothetical protein
MTIDASAMSLPDITVTVSASDAYASVARGDVFTSAIGFAISSPLPTIQSSAFFNTPGTPCAYSGLEISTASASAHRRRNVRTTSGASRSSISGLNAGTSAS